VRRLAARLGRERRDGAVRICRRDGQVFLLQPECRSGLPLDVRGMDLEWRREDIVALVRESRRPA
jgi:hypothetical protein